MVVTRACNQKFYKIVKSSNNGITSKIKFRFKVANNVFTKINLCDEATKWLCGNNFNFFSLIFFSNYVDQIYRIHRGMPKINELVNMSSCL